MTNILELLKNEKVEWKKIQDISKRIVSGGTPNRSNTKYYGGSIPWLRTQEIDFNEIHSTELYITEDGLANSSATLIEPNTIIVAMYGATAGKVALTKIPLTTNQACCNIEVNKEVIKYRYVYYWLVNNYKVLKSMGQGSQSNINSSIIKNFPIPIPSLETQEKIVEILDTFTNSVTELQSELRSELQLRIKQYTYFRDMLLSEEYLNKVTKEMEEDRRLKIVQLDEVVKIKNGKDWKELEEGDIPVYGSGGEMGVYVSKYAYDKPTVLIPRKGSIRNVFYMETPFWNVDTIFYTEIDESKLIPKYFYYFIEYFDLSKLSENSTRPSLTQSTLNRLKFPLPSLSLQNKIVKILDKFQVMLADTKRFLPEEIEQRQKQYEYYREKLLTFETDCDSTHARTLILSNYYYEILHEAANSVGLNIEDKVEQKRLEETCEIIAGGDTPKNNMSDKKEGIYNIPIISNGIEDKSIYGWTNIGKIMKPSITISARGTIGWANLIEEPFYPIVRLLVLTPRIEVNIKYIYYLMKKKENTYIIPKTGIPQLTKPMIKDVELHLPPLHVQQHIVSILDKFDTLVHDIKEGLPKEIELRQKQYEYWREQLLSFNR